MTSSSQRTAGGEDRHQGDHDQHDRAAADVVSLGEGAGEGAEEGVGLVAGGFREDLGDAVGGGDDGVEDQGVNAEAMTVSQRKPTASEIAVVRGTPRTARFATARSHRRRVRMVDAAKTTAYC